MGDSRDGVSLIRRSHIGTRSSAVEVPRRSGSGAGIWNRRGRGGGGHHPGCLLGKVMPLGLVLMLMFMLVRGRGRALTCSQCAQPRMCCGRHRVQCLWVKSDISFE